MGVSIPNELSNEWYNFVENGLTDKTTYQRMSEASYDAGNGVVTHAVEAEYPGIEVIWSEFGFSISSAGINKFDDSSILSIDRKLIFPTLLLPVVANIGDRVVDDSGNIWNIRGIGVDPANAGYKLHVRPIEES